MKNIIIKFSNSLFEDDRAIESVISYIANGAKIIGGYGFWPVDPQAISQQFNTMYDTNPPIFSRRIWHFFINFSPLVDKNSILSIADDISYLLSHNYQNFYGLHAKRQYGQYRYHLHIAVLPVSYHPGAPELTPDIMQSYITAISELIFQKFHLIINLINPESIKI